MYALFRLSKLVYQTLLLILLFNFTNVSLKLSTNVQLYRDGTPSNISKHFKTNVLFFIAKCLGGYGMFSL